MSDPNMPRDPVSEPEILPPEGKEDAGPGHGGRKTEYRMAAGGSKGFAAGIVMLMLVAITLTIGIALLFLAAGLAVIIFPIALGLIAVVAFVAWLRRSPAK